MAELNIGHALIADAVFLSLAGAVKAMQEAMLASAPDVALDVAPLAQ
jgi:pyridoxine 5'-phosphate synthase PdxJ